jgi:hypothetical protein
LGLYNGNNDPTTATPHQFQWASIIGTEVNNDMVALSSQLETPWANNNSPTLDRSDIEFGEINNHYVNNEFDATILEVAYHDDPNDVLILRDPKARDWVARASIEAAIKYFNTYDATPLNQPPETPTNVRATAGNGDVTVAWARRWWTASAGMRPAGMRFTPRRTVWGLEMGSR